MRTMNSTAIEQRRWQVERDAHLKDGNYRKWKLIRHNDALNAHQFFFPNSEMTLCVCVRATVHARVSSAAHRSTVAKRQHCRIDMVFVFTPLATGIRR